MTLYHKILVIRSTYYYVESFHEKVHNFFDCVAILLRYSDDMFINTAVAHPIVMLNHLHQHRCHSYSFEVVQSDHHPYPVVPGTLAIDIT